MQRRRMSQLVASAAFLFSFLTLMGCAREEQQAVTKPGAEDDQAIEAIPHLLQQNFRVFRVDSAGLPRRLETVLGPAPFGANWAFAQQVHKGTWAVPARSRICLVQRGPKGSAGVGCTRTQQVFANGMFITSLKDPSLPGLGARREIVGLAPDGTRKVRLITPGYRTATAPVDHGVFVHRDDIPASPLTTILLPR